MRKKYCAYLPQEIVPDGLRIDVSTRDEVLGVLGFCLPGPEITECRVIREAEEVPAIRALEDDIVRAWKEWMQSNEERRLAAHGKPEVYHRVALSQSQI